MHDVTVSELQHDDAVINVKPTVTLWIYTTAFR